MSVRRKIVCFGPDLAGRTTTLCCVHRAAKEIYNAELQVLEAADHKKLLTLKMTVPPPADRSSSEDYEIHVMTFLGPWWSRELDRLLLESAACILFVADSRRERFEANMEKLELLRELLREHGRSLDEVPHIFQYNKRDLPEAMPLSELEAALNPGGAPSFETVATTGLGVPDAVGCAIRMAMRPTSNK